MNSQKQFSILLMEAGDSGQGGSFVSLSQLLALLASKGHALHVILWNDSPHVSRYREIGATVTVYPHPFYNKTHRLRRYIYNKFNAGMMRLSPRLLPWFELICQWRCYRYLIKYALHHQIDIIHTNNQIVRNFIGFLIAKKIKRPIVAHLRTLHSYGLTQAHSQVLRAIRCRVIATSPSVARHWQQQGLSAEQIHILPNPYDGELNDLIVEKPVEKKLVYVGRLESGKGLHCLLQAFAILLKREGDFTLSLIGEGSLKDDLQQYSQQLGVNTRVNFMGYIHDAKQRLAEFDALVFPSQQEGFGRVLLEAMAARLPIIATKVPGIIDIIKSHDNGVLVAYDQPQQLADAILALFQNTLLRNKLIERGYQTVRQGFSTENYYQQLYPIYESLQPYDLCIVISDLGAGGTQRVLINLLSAWHKQYRIALITLSDAVNDFYQLPNGVTRFSIQGVNKSNNILQGVSANIRRLWRLRSLIVRCQPRWVLSFIAPTNILTILATRGLSTKVIISERNDPAKQSFGKHWDLLRKIYYRYADSVTANSHGALQQMQAYVPKRKLHWVPNPLVPPTAMSVPIMFNKPTILAVGRLHPQKAYDILLPAFAAFEKQFPAWQLVILGDGPLKEPLQQFALQLGISEAVAFQGNVPNPFDYYRAATLFVLASRHEGSPNVLLEAMYCGLPAIITNASPGPLEYITHAVNGWVVEKENITALSQAMCLLASDPLLQKKLADAACQAININSLSAVLAAWDDLFIINEQPAHEKS
jgi:GalNAc-alpha-(1->4)-GalNAc-alpha-(1->3)-diNAcBac-PP-undecaprenol alpha-1,4-N-acetyl-D-galactosaminyltransferase